MSTIGIPLSPNAVSADVDTNGMGTTAAAWLASLDGRQRIAAHERFDTADRANWHYVPRRRPGLALRDMNPQQRDLVWRFLATCLSARGMEKAQGVLEIEQVLAELSGNHGLRDPGNYALVMFGDPGREEPWSWRFEGHHLSLTLTIVPNVGVAATPSFFGSNPAIVPHGHAKAGLEILRRERGLGFELLHALGDEERETTVIAARSMGDIVTGPGREQALKEPQGLALGAMDDAHRAMAMALVETFISHLRAGLMDREIARIREHGIERIHFAWAGSHELGSPHYYRLHGPSLVIEYDNTQNDANHVHTVWHDPTDSFGRDLLKAHYDHGHH